ncbi:MAG TPA: AraC family transcriptional regulator, partial [Myxococcales bacterium]|nr:AraC family transcriptional regulator [Myxococcales bacterium]
MRLTTSAAWVRGIAEMLAREGFDSGELLAAAGIDKAALDAPGARLSTEKVSRLWEVAAERSGNPAIALAQHQVARPQSFDVVGYAMMSCANLQEALERLLRYLRVLSDALTMTKTVARGRYYLTFDLSGGTRPVPRQRVEYIFSTLVTFCRWVSGRDLQPLLVEIPYPPPADLAPYREAFRCQLKFDAPVGALLFSLDDLMVPLPTSNPRLAELHERYAGEYLEHFDRRLTSYRVRQVIVRRLPDGEPRRDQVARELCM